MGKPEVCRGAEVSGHWGDLHLLLVQFQVWSGQP